MSKRKQTKKRVNGSASAFMSGDLVYTESWRGCLRATMLNTFGITDKSPFPEKYRVMGELNEQLYETAYGDEGASFKREQEIRHDIQGYADVYYNSRADFVFDSGRIVEHKSIDSNSKSTMTKVIKKGNFKLDNLAQLVSYMISLKSTEGNLVYTVYKQQPDGSYEQTSLAQTFDVKFDSWGNIWANNQPSGWSVDNQYQHRLASAKVISEPQVAARPHNWDSSWASPCTFCPFKDACEAWDSEIIDSVDEFIDMSEESASKNVR